MSTGDGVCCATDWAGMGNEPLLSSYFPGLVVDRRVSLLAYNVRYRVVETTEMTLHAFRSILI